MGHSFGATIALEYAARYPEHVQELIVVDGAVNLPQTWKDWAWENAGHYPQPWQAAVRGER